MEKIRREDALILAHYYAPAEVQKIADFVGDSYALAKRAKISNRQIIIFCGVSFMGESAKILCPEKRVYLPVPTARCAMAEMIDEEEIERMRREVPDLAVVTYINSGARTKALSDVVVTSANAEKIVSALPQKNIYFIPDRHLGRYVAARDRSGKTFYFGKGYCPVHAKTSVEEVLRAKAEHPNAPFLTHPECPQEVCALADFVGSTAGIISYAEQSEAREFLIGTETGIAYELTRRCPDKKFYFTRTDFICEDMKKITKESVLNVLEGKAPPVEVEEETRAKAARALEKMLELAK